MNLSWEAAKNLDLDLPSFPFSCFLLVPTLSVLAISFIFWESLVVGISELIFRYIKQIGGSDITMTISMSAFGGATHLREPRIS